MTSTRKLMNTIHETYQRVKELGGTQEARIFMLWAYLSMHRYQKPTNKEWLTVEPLKSMDKQELVFIVRIKK